MDAEALIDAIDAVQVIDYCYCGRPVTEHVYWEDRVYDYNGRSCPGRLGGEYRYDSSSTKAHHRRARAAILATWRPAEAR